jgi:hypothetical protein
MGLKPDRWVTILGFLLTGMVVISGCATLYDPESSQEFNTDILGTISPGHSVGQVFISRRARLNGITLWLETDEPGSNLLLDLFHTPTDTVPIFSTSATVSPGINHIAIDPQTDPPNHKYFIELRTTNSTIKVLGRDEDNYPHGNAFVNDNPIQGDLAFRASYDYDLKAGISDLQVIFEGFWLILPLMVLLLLPGWLILDFTRQAKTYDPGEKTAMSLGLSIAMIPVIMLWTSTLGLVWNPLRVRIAAGVILLLFAFRLGWKCTALRGRSIQNPKHIGQNATMSILILIFAGAFFIRFAMVRDLAAPAWVDSVHHSLITNSILEQGGYPEDSLPHIPVAANQYHPGYHGLLATFHWLTGIPLQESMLILGQVLNALMIFQVYLLGTTLVKNRVAGLVAALITGFLLLMPAYYTSWGRYTQLTGLLVLPAGIRWISGTVKLPSKLTEIILGGIFLAGLFLIHYRVTIFLGCLVIAIWIGRLYRPSRYTRIQAGVSAGTTAIFGISGILIALPWLIPSLNEFAILLEMRWRGNPALSATHWKFLTPVFGIPVMITAGAGLALGFLQRRRFSITILIWGLLLFGTANSTYFHLPFLSRFINQTSVEIMFFMPLSVMAGYIISQGIALTLQWIPDHKKWIHTTVVVMLGIMIAILGSRVLLTVLNPTTFLFRNADKPAMDWIRENIPENETFVINPTGWGYGLYMGSDGGFWISPLTNRITIPPNVLYGMDKIERIRINQFVEELLQCGEDPEAVYKLLQEQGYRFIYIGARGGLFSPQALGNSPYFKQRYHGTGTWIFEAGLNPSID